MTQIYPAYQVTCADIDRLKVVASRVFNRKVSPQSRLEIIARSAGFGSFAALKAALSDGPVRLFGNQRREEDHITSSGIDPRLVPFINGISLNEIISAGLAWPERDDPEWAAIKPPRQKLKALKRDGGTMRDYLQFLYGELRTATGPFQVYRSSLTWEDLRQIEAEARQKELCEDTAVIFSSPENAFMASTDPETAEPRAARPGSWRCARVPLSRDVRILDIPPAQSVPWGDRGALEALIKDARIIVFDEADLKSIKDALARSGISGLPEYRFVMVKTNALLLEDEDEGDFFTVGYYGTSRGDIASSETCRDETALSDFAFEWLFEIVTVVHACAYEMERMVVDDDDDYEAETHGVQNRLTVSV